MRILRAVGPSAVALIFLAACSSGGSAPAGSSPAASASGATGGSGATGATTTAQQALLQAATQEANATSVIEQLNIQDSGTQNTTATGTIELQRRPTEVIAENLNVTAAGKSTQVKAIITATALYINEAALTSQVGKPWIKVSLSALQHTPALATLAQLVHSVEGNNAVDLVRLFAATKNVRVVASQTVDGVPTTEYAGSFQAAELAKVLAPGLRTALGPALQAMGNGTVNFHMWVDGQHQLRKVTETEMVNGLNVSTTLTITETNQPLHIAFPPASQTFTQPGL